MTWVFYQSHLLSKERKQAWEKKLPFWISVGSWAKTNDNLAAAWNTSRFVFWSTGSSYAFSQVRSTDYCLCRADRIHFFQIFVNLGCSTYILPIMILQPGNKSLVSSKTTSGIVKTIKMTATYMHLEKHSISKFSLTRGLGIVCWELNLANVSKPADLMRLTETFVAFCWIMSIAEWLICILPLSQLVFQFPFIQTVNQTTLLIVVFTVFWQHCPGSYGKQNQGKLGKPLVFPFKSKINLIIHDLEGMFYITKCNITKDIKLLFLSKQLYSINFFFWQWMFLYSCHEGFY